MIEIVIKATCDMCGEIKYMKREDMTFYGWTTEHCPKHKRFKGKRPHNLSPEELRKAVMTFAAEVDKRRLG
jgi:hypothetical protein